MKVPTNKLKDIFHYYNDQLIPIYGEAESKHMLQMLIEHFFGYDRMAMALNPDIRLSESEMLSIHFAVKDLQKFKPVQYIIGKTYFNGLWFDVNKDVLIPRPETEELVEIAKDFLRKHPQKKRVLDIGTGSGCIAISLAISSIDLQVHALDISEKAIEVAKNNAKKLNANVVFYFMDICAPTSNFNQMQFDVIVSNPPYVTESDKQMMLANVIDWEPATALFAPSDDPIYFYRKIIDFANTHLLPDGLLLFELNEQNGKEVVDLLQINNYKEISLLQDIHGKTRFASALAR